MAAPPGFGALTLGIFAGWSFFGRLGVATVDIGGALGELMAINCRDKDGCWIEYIRIRVKINIQKSLRLVVKIMGVDGTRLLCTVKYERLPIFCYKCGCIGRKTQKCPTQVNHHDANDSNLHWTRDSAMSNSSDSS
ncbi:hypothetical protein PVK06_047865 [Gossypium arboreum]|uniref:Zinc knuckle CX2CX4HX4C domain-containing protein n=1 Tax=Gossypium arboreum TaxID=29729 RepID=A0ABR0MEX0_GOSAR|nr:hypothetical protein PVK06_047865 [Gossypium arboreum]